MISTPSRYVAEAPEEELAGPFIPSSPTQAKERISAIDVLRGFSLLGILAMNIDDFGIAEGTHDIPVSTPTPSFSGPHARWNLAVLLFKWCFFEGKMRGIFSLLFGAGVILLTSRMEERGASATMADVFTRRNLLLLCFGLFHGIFIWDGDILFDYGLCALLFLYPARKLSARTLIWTGIMASLTVSTLSAGIFTHAFDNLSQAHRETLAIRAAQSHTPADPAGIASAQKQQQAFIAAQSQKTADHVAEKVKGAHAGYLVMVQENLGGYFGPGVLVRVLTIESTLPLMLMGMGLFKLGFFSAQCSTRVYVWTVLVGFGISLPIYIFGLLHAYTLGFSVLALDAWIWLPYMLSSDAGMFAIVATFMLLIKHSVFRGFQGLLAAVGRTAFSNYIGTSLLCQFIFIWAPWKLYGKLEYYQLLYVVLGIWAVNLIVSTLWLRSFEYGPLEWLWRSLTYGKRQPMRLRAVPSNV